jgi:hypothetical protein
LQTIKPPSKTLPRKLHRSNLPNIFEAAGYMQDAFCRASAGHFADYVRRDFLICPQLNDGQGAWSNRAASMLLARADDVID